VPNYGGDDHAHRSKDLNEDGRRLPSDVRMEREYFCRTCGRVARSQMVPSGWYVLQRASGVIGRSVRLGLYCSLTCLTDMLPRLDWHALEWGPSSRVKHRRAGTCWAP